MILILSLAIVLSLNITSESWADDVTIVDSGNCGINGNEPDRLENLDLICKGENCETIKMKLMNYELYDCITFKE